MFQKGAKAMLAVSRYNDPVVVVYSIWQCEV